MNSKSDLESLKTGFGLMEPLGVEQKYFFPILQK